MRYTFAYKLECVSLYRQGKWPEPPKGIKNVTNFHNLIIGWSKYEEMHGEEVLMDKKTHKVWTAEMKYALVAPVIAGQSINSVAYEAGISRGTLHHWVCKFKELGYNGLVNNPPGRKKSNKSDMKKQSKKSKPLTDEEREELIRLRKEVEYIKAENEVIKKEIALRQERWAAQLKAKKQQSSKNSEKKGTN